MLAYTHFTLDERKRLQELLFEGNTIRMIARSLGRSASTISREIQRNSSKKGYHHWRAETLCTVRRRQKRMTALPEGSPARDYVIKKLNRFWSPEEIARRWRKDNDGETLGVSTIYRYIKRGELFGIRRKTHLRRRGKHYSPRNALYNTIHPDRTIPEWPQEIKQRSRIGDWEGDTVYGGVGKGVVVTCVDRKSRFLIAGLVYSRTADLTQNAIESLFHGLPVHSLSLDNGSEFSNFREIEKTLKAPIYFAEPHKPWQRGTNENTNDILRFFFPKGCDFHSITNKQLDDVVYLINTRPRKCLGWLSPFEVFYGVALA